MIVPNIDYLEYKDNYNYIQIADFIDSTRMLAHIQVPLKMVRQKRYRHKFLFFRWGKKTDIIKAYSDNKYAKITELSVVDIK